MKYMKYMKYKNKSKPDNHNSLIIMGIIFSVYLAIGVSPAAANTPIDTRVGADGYCVTSYEPDDSGCDPLLDSCGYELCLLEKEIWAHSDGKYFAVLNSKYRDVEDKLNECKIGDAKKKLAGIQGKVEGWHDPEQKPHPKKNGVYIGSTEPKMAYEPAQHIWCAAQEVFDCSSSISCSP